MRKQFNNKSAVSGKSRITDAFYNGFVYKAGASQLMDECAARGYSQNMVVTELCRSFQANRQNSQMTNRYIGGALLGIQVLFAAMTGGVGSIGLVFMGAWSYVFASSFPTVLGVKNPLAKGLDPANDYERAAKLATHSYPKRLQLK